MVTIAQRIAELRSEKNIPAGELSKALGMPKTAIEKLEAGRQTPTKEQLDKLAAYFGVSAEYLQGATDDRTGSMGWMESEFRVPDEEPVRPAVKARPEKKKEAGESGTMGASLLESEAMKAAIRSAVLEVLKSPEGEEILRRVVKKELINRK